MLCFQAFSEFDKLGIPRLLDPTQMMFSPVPDKLSVMTYVYQIKNRFAQQQVAQPSPLNLRKPVPRSRPAPPPPVASKEVPVNSLENKSSVGSAKGKGDSKDAFNPFLEELEDAEKDVSSESMNQSKTAPSDVTKDQKSGKKELVSESSNASPEINNVLETSSKDLDTNETGPSKPPRKPPRKVSGPDNSVEDVKTKASGPVNEKGKVESKEGYNPFDEEEETEAAASPKGNVAVPLKTKKPPAGYNPFDEEETLDSQEKDASVKERKVGYNPFDEDGEDKEETRQKKVSYPHSFNPFEGEDDVKSKDDKKLNESSSKAYNPFDDENDDSHIMNDASTPVKNSTRKSSVENKTKAVAQAGSASPSRALKQPVSCSGIFCSTCPSFSIILRALTSFQSQSAAGPVLQMERVCSAQLRKLLSIELVRLPEQGLFARKRLALDNVGSSRTLRKSCFPISLTSLSSSRDK